MCVRCDSRSDAKPGDCEKRPPAPTSCYSSGNQRQSCVRIWEYAEDGKWLSWVGRELRQKTDSHRRLYAYQKKRPCLLKTGLLKIGFKCNCHAVTCETLVTPCLGTSLTFSLRFVGVPPCRANCACLPLDFSGRRSQKSFRHFTDGMRVPRRLSIQRTSRENPSFLLMSLSTAT